MTAYLYTGPDERVYTAYLAVAEDGTVSTLVGEPGGQPVAVMRAVGSEALPEIPCDGLWVPEAADTSALVAFEDHTPPDEAPAGKPAKTVKVVTG